ncbi:unnamed protein product [Caenorhabditis angaria]|uniref:Uncharacterized protein n=1 Tax=Caenorhabditis angaria TaxID=860376 RepID=A0A9P1IDI1_9PELO|nr:unnamed protein product [Caenorhabditis angaria]
MSLFYHIFIIFFLTDFSESLGGKPFNNALSRDMTGKNYAILVLCDETIKGHAINVTLALRNDFGEELERIQFKNSREPLVIEDHLASNITEVVLTADSSDIPYIIRKVSLRIRDTLFKLHINQECDDEPEFLTSKTEQTYWSRRIDCERKDVYCDDRHDEFIGCESVFV